MSYSRNAIRYAFIMVSAVRAIMPYASRSDKAGGFATVNPKLWEDWDDADIRKKRFHNRLSGQERDASLSQRRRKRKRRSILYKQKHCPINVYADATKQNVVNYSVPLYGMTETNFQLNNTQDIILIRFSDVLPYGSRTPDVRRHRNTSIASATA